jgi:hypothetical protein
MDQMTVTLPQITEEVALGQILNWLRNAGTRRHNPDNHSHGHSLYIPALINDLLVKRGQELRNPNVGFSQTSYDYGSINRTPYYAAAWSLCRRGILCPAPADMGNQLAYAQTPGAGFWVTEYGTQWLSTQGANVTPIEGGAFGKILAKHDARFGVGYSSRSQEALRCYGARTYLACCVMCGAAAESITLALAIAKKGDEEEVLALYNKNAGRSQIEKLLVTGQNSYVKDQIPGYLELLKYWRDSAAHGTVSTVGEEHAFLMMMLLMRFALFADERWGELTAPAV